MTQDWSHVLLVTKGQKQARCLGVRVTEPTVGNLELRVSASQVGEAAMPAIPMHIVQASEGGVSGRSQR